MTVGHQCISTVIIFIFIFVLQFTATGRFCFRIFSSTYGIFHFDSTLIPLMRFLQLRTQSQPPKSKQHNIPKRF